MSQLNFTNLRVFIDEDQHNIYSTLTGRAAKDAEDVPFNKMPDLFIAAACVGAKEGLFSPLKSKKKDIFVADAFDQTTQIPVMAALAFEKTSSIETLTNPKEILEICQAWASGGINIVQDQVLSGKGLRPLYRLVDFVQEED
jgi:hypothetical protein